GQEISFNHKKLVFLRPLKVPVPPCFRAGPDSKFPLSASKGRRDLHKASDKGSGWSVARYRASMGCWRSSVQIRPPRQMNQKSRRKPGFLRCRARANSFAHARKRKTTAAPWALTYFGFI